ncbi:MAG TPA: hypothetical protein VGO47_07675 [Chlamydiales bacterium]|nr:hypothetical protein [Chlamydiales bacterium]
MTQRFGKLKKNKHQLAIASDRTNPVFPADLPLDIDNDRESEFETLILKDSWPLSDRATEGDVFKPLANRFGLPTVVHFYTVTSPEQEADCTASLLPSNTSPSTLWGGNVNKVPESRIHTRILIATQGRPLGYAAGPKEMTLAVLHSMLGESMFLSPSRYR